MTSTVGVIHAHNRRETVTRISVCMYMFGNLNNTSSFMRPINPVHEAVGRLPREWPVVSTFMLGSCFGRWVVDLLELQQ